MLPENIFKEMAREGTRNERKDRTEQKQEYFAKRKSKVLEQQRDQLEQGMLRCPRRARARVHCRVLRSLPRDSDAVHAGAAPTPSGPWSSRAST